MGEEPNRTTARTPEPLEIIQYSLGKCFNSGYVDVAHLDLQKTKEVLVRKDITQILSLCKKRKRYSQSI